MQFHQIIPPLLFPVVLFFFRECFPPLCCLVVYILPRVPLFPFLLLLFDPFTWLFCFFPHLARPVIFRTVVSFFFFLVCDNNPFSGSLFFSLHSPDALSKRFPRACRVGATRGPGHFPLSRIPSFPVLWDFFLSSVFIPPSHLPRPPVVGGETTAFIVFQLYFGLKMLGFFFDPHPCFPNMSHPSSTPPSLL